MNLWKQLRVYGLFIFCIALVVCSCIHIAHAQYFPSKIYPKDYFSNPLGIPIQLSGNFGEVRNEHFHMGLDIRTERKENLPVYASASGYISRIKIERYGYGRAIYIKHPNGYTTLYAHLNNFYDTLHNYVKSKQYTEQQWEQDFEFAPNQFPVVKGQFIAFSGNTGGSQGPHLHFEIRNEQGDNVNPLLFNLNIEDNIPPAIEKLFLYDRTASTYRNSPTEISIVKNKDGYATKDSIIYIGSNTISFGITAQDVTNASPFKFGIYQAEVWVDSIMAFVFRLNDFSYNDSRYVNGCIDYVTKYNRGATIQHLAKLPGNQLNIFSATTGNGVIELKDTSIKQVEIVVKDVAGNASSLLLRVQKKDSLATVQHQFSEEVFVPNAVTQFNKQDMQLHFNEAAFYDTIPVNLTVNNGYGKTTMVSKEVVLNPQIPVHTSYSVALSLTESINDSLKNKVVVLLKNKSFAQAKIPEWKNTIATTNFDRLGTIALVVDTVPPSIQPIGWKNNFTFNNQTQIVVQVKDAVSDIKKYTAILDSQWVLFSRKNDLYIYDFDEHCGLGKHQLTILAEDIAGNCNERTFFFTKEPPKANKSKMKTLVKGKKKKQSSSTKKRKKK